MKEHRPCYIVGRNEHRFTMTAMVKCVCFLLFLSFLSAAHAKNAVRTSTSHERPPRRGRRRNLAAGNYHSLWTAQLGLPNPEAAIGNPLKGLMPSPQYSRPPYTPTLPHSLEFYYVGKAACLRTGTTILPVCFALSLPLLFISNVQG
jgi:hypothetical protein